MFSVFEYVFPPTHQHFLNVCCQKFNPSLQPIMAKIFIKMLITSRLLFDYTTYNGLFFLYSQKAT